jgi:hypothetical protein
MKPEELPEDIDGNQDDNPYNQTVGLYPFANRGSGPFSLAWQEREYWRHWKRVKKDTGHWPFWSAAFHVVLLSGVLLNMVLFLSARDSHDWSTGRSWLIGGIFAALWLVFLGVGRDVIRSYEAKLYTTRESERKHFVTRA